MTTDRLPKVLLNYKPRWYRNIGRPMARWEDEFSWNRKQSCGLYPWSRRRRTMVTKVTWIFPTLSLRRTEKHKVLHVKWPLLLTDFNQNRYVPTNFIETPQ
jgi:hypothetical protein